MAATHCWADRVEAAIARWGYNSPQHIDAAVDREQGKTFTCCLLAGHRGPHQWEQDRTISVEFAGSEGN